MSRRTICLAFLVALVAGPASAAELRLEISGGFVTLVATDTPLRQILAEWARVGGTRIVNGERITGPPVTLQLQQMPEQEALAVLLRSAAGYLAAPRRAGSAGASMYESVMILATSTPPAAAATPPATGARGPVNPVARPIPSQVEMLGQQPLMPDGDDQVVSEGFITVGSAPTPRQTPAAGAAGAAATGGPMGSPFPPVPVAGARTPAQQPPSFPGSRFATPNGLPRPTNLPPGIMLPNDGTRIQTNDDQP